MKPIIFARVSDMKYYKGITENDCQVNGGSFVKENNYAHECYNFEPVPFDDGNEYCLGFVQLIGGGTGDTQLHIEKIVGCERFKDAEEVDDVIVVFCSKALNSNSMRVVGFYKHATVFRNYMRESFLSNELNEDAYVQFYSFIAEKSDCILIPYQERFIRSEWYVPTSSKKGSSFGFGHSNIWFAGSKTTNSEEIAYVERMIKSVENYTE